MPGTRPPGVQILSISCSFWEILAKSYVGAPRWVGAPSPEKSWIRHCNSSMILLPITVWKSINIMKFVLYMFSQQIIWIGTLIPPSSDKGDTFNYDTPEVWNWSSNQNIFKCFTFSERILGIPVRSTMISKLCHWNRPATTTVVIIYPMLTDFLQWNVSKDSTSCGSFFWQ